MCFSSSPPAPTPIEQPAQPEYAAYGDKAQRSVKYQQANAKGTNSTDITKGLDFDLGIGSKNNNMLLSPLGMSNANIQQTALLGFSR